MPEVLIKPTIGRRIWYWPGSTDMNSVARMHVIEPNAAQPAPQPLEAGIIFVHSDTCVNLQVTDHMGGIWFREKVRILQEGDDHNENDSLGVAQWMHYQAGQAAREKEAALPSASPQTKGVCNDERACAACYSNQGDCLATKEQADSWREVWSALGTHAPSLVYSETAEPAVVRAVRAIETLSKRFAKSDEHKRVNEGILYPAIRNAMSFLGRFPPDHNIVVDQAFNQLYDAYWSETPPPSGAAPKRVIRINPVTGARRDLRDIESDPYATLCVSPKEAEVPASHATALSETAWREANAREKQAATGATILGELVADPKPVVVSDDVRADVANRRYGVSYGVDWVYAGKPGTSSAGHACKGERCGSTTGFNHSPECIAEAAISQAWPDDTQRRGAMRKAEQAYKDRDAELLALGKVTDEYLLGEIRSEFYFTAEDGVLGESELGTSPANWTGLDRVTFCVLLIHNNVKLVGVNYGSLQANEFDKDKARMYARNAAVQALREHLAFRLRDLQHRARVKA